MIFLKCAAKQEGFLLGFKNCFCARLPSSFAPPPRRLPPPPLPLPSAPHPSPRPLSAGWWSVLPTPAPPLSRPHTQLMRQRLALHLSHGGRLPARRRLRPGPSSGDASPPSGAPAQTTASWSNLLQLHGRPFIPEIHAVSARCQILAAAKSAEKTTPPWIILAKRRALEEAEDTSPPGPRWQVLTDAGWQDYTRSVQLELEEVHQTGGSVQYI